MCSKLDAAVLGDIAIITWFINIRERWVRHGRTTKYILTSHFDDNKSSYIVQNYIFYDSYILRLIVNKTLQEEERMRDKAINSRAQHNKHMICDTTLLQSSLIKQI